MDDAAQAGVALALQELQDLEGRLQLFRVGQGRCLHHGHCGHVRAAQQRGRRVLATQVCQRCGGGLLRTAVGFTLHLVRTTVHVDERCTQGFSRTPLTLCEQCHKFVPEMPQLGPPVQQQVNEPSVGSSDSAAQPAVPQEAPCASSGAPCASSGASSVAQQAGEWELVDASASGSAGQGYASQPSGIPRAVARSQDAGGIALGQQQSGSSAAVHSP